MTPNIGLKQDIIQLTYHVNKTDHVLSQVII